MVNPSPSVAACLVVHDNRSGLGNLLQSLRSQTVPIAELIVCLTGEEWGGAEADILNAFPQARLIERADNPGFSGGINACLQVTEADLVLSLNPDTELGVDYVARCMRVFDDDPRVAAVGGLLLREGGQGRDVVDSAGFALQPWFRIVDRGAGSSDIDRFQDEEDVLGVCGAAALFDHQALLRIMEEGQVMDEDFWMYKEDQDLCLRLLEAGHRVVFAPTARARHGRGWAPGTRRTTPLALRQHSLKNRYLLIWKHWRWQRHLWMVPFILAFELFLLAALLLREPAVITGYRRALALLPRMLNKRKHLILQNPARRRQLEQMSESTGGA